MTKTYIFQFPKDKIEIFDAIDNSDSRENVIKQAAAQCGAKVDGNSLDGNIRIMKVRCTTETQQSYILLKCSAYL